MKNLKKALFFIIPIVILVVLTILPFLLNTNSGFIGGAQYLKLLLKDSLTWKALLYTIGAEFLIALIAVAVFNFVLKKVKPQLLNGFKKLYLVNFFVGAVVSFVALLFLKEDWLFVINQGGLIWYYVIIFAIFTGVVLALLSWLISLRKTKKGIQ